MIENLDENNTEPKLDNKCAHADCAFEKCDFQWVSKKAQAEFFLCNISLEPPISPRNAQHSPRALPILPQYHSTISHHHVQHLNEDVPPGKKKRHGCNLL